MLRTAIFDGITLQYILYAIICGKSATPFYYVIVMMQLTIITPWLIRCRKKWMYLVTPAYLTIIYTYNIVTGTVPLFYETLFPAWFFFYLLGMDCRSGNIGKLLKNVKNVKGYWITIALFVSVAEAFVLNKVGCADGFVVSQIKFGSFLYATALVLWLLKKKNEPRSNIFSIAGDYSYGIFYCHILILWGIRKIIEIAGLNEIWMMYFGLCFIFTAVGSFTFVWIVRSLAKKLKCEKMLILFGF